eukprot:12673502-Ditylum_brightwellii.AAC.1
MPFKESSFPCTLPSTPPTAEHLAFLLLQATLDKVQAFASQRGKSAQNNKEEHFEEEDSTTIIGYKEGGDMADSSPLFMHVGRGEANSLLWECNKIAV